MADHSLLSPWIRRFLLEHLVAERNLAHNTQQSYRDALCLLLPFASKLCKKRVDALTVYDLSGDVIKAFLSELERVRRCTIGTRNQRLAAIHALGRFIGERSPEHVQWCGQIRSIPFKRCEKNSITYLEKEEIDALLEVPDQSTRLGRRDYALLLFLYNSEARASEAVRDDRRSGAEPRRNRIRETPRKREEGPLLPAMGKNYDRTAAADPWTGQRRQSVPQ